VDTPAISNAVKGFILARRAAGRSENTIRDYQVHLVRLTTYLNDPNISAITPKQIEGFFNHLQHDFTFQIPNTDIVRSLSPKTVANAFTAISAFWVWVEDEFSVPSPIKMKRIRAKTQPIFPLTEDEIDRLLAACNSSTVSPDNRRSFTVKRTTRVRDKAIIMVLYDTGVRVTEMCNMRFRDLDMDNNRIFVTGKGKKSRYVIFGNATGQVLWRYVVSRFPREKADQDEYIFVDNQGMRPITRNSVRQLLRRLGESAGVPDVHPHRLRHTFAVHYLKNGGEIYSLADLLGHSTLEMVRNYLHLAERDIHDAHRRASPGDHLFRR
jgi:integrase/recombinase XerD